MADQASGKKKVISRTDWIIIIVVGAILLYFFLQNVVGVPVVEQTDETEIVDDPHKGY